MNGIAARREQAEVEREHGSLAELEERMEALGSRALQPSPLLELQRKEATTTQSIEALMSGIEQMRGRVLTANLAAFAAIRASCISSFGELVPSMELALDLEQDDPNGEVHPAAEQQLPLGRAQVTCRIRNRDGSNPEWRSGLGELSGGQRTLLNISLLLAVAKFNPSMLLLMDEVDAALDEVNGRKVALMLRDVSKVSQVIAISHRQEFHQLADHIVSLAKRGDFTAVGSAVQ
eukprot:CAMPEP_0181206074 /NCGR_PEP_ID=MMETSP1096-20121128/20834_1 /TAXON_ID=156174 ORGANISM="Chrysochromulina ericina, Strain CCMP281" /NCGR_SAMPLE_ID=MMETSP1096 /ASSEMBLY_ACC=CAM_ASM_000453 /LENGTH=233 /DNA_ID=CAMNT_0023296935 /DNA_START=3 /DNA_END=704 /DNA_ORIENTATION=+